MAQQPQAIGKRTPRSSSRRPHRHNPTAQQQQPERNKQNLFSLGKKRVSSRILKIEFPISRPSRPKVLQQHTPSLTPLLENNQNATELKYTQSEELEEPTVRMDLHTERWRGWRLRKCSNLIAPIGENLQQQLQTHLRKRTLAERENLRPQLVPTVDDPLASTKRAIDRLIRERIEGWQQSSNSDQEDSGPKRS